jgi:pectate lyase
VDDANRPLACPDYEAGTGYTLDEYLRAYDPAVWGRTRVPNGPLETARNAAHLNQQNRVRITIPSNTTLVGSGSDARISGAYVRVNNAQNVIIRNVTFEDAYDCFPQWDPTDGALGNWNSSYDNLGLLGAANVWVDHCEFTDGPHPDELQPFFFGREFVVHDGALDITNASDLVTVSWNHFARHDKLMLIGSSDTATGDIGKLRVTLHHNFFDSNVQRAPRVRFGQVHVYNNYYRLDPSNYSYSWGVGVQSQIVAQNNYFQTSSGRPGLLYTGIEHVPASRIISRFSGDAIFVKRTLVDGRVPVDVLGEYNRTHEPDLSNGVGWVPFLYNEMDSPQTVSLRVPSMAGVFRGRVRF